MTRKKGCPLIKSLWHGLSWAYKDYGGFSNRLPWPDPQRLRCGLYTGFLALHSIWPLVFLSGSKEQVCVPVH